VGELSEVKNVDVAIDAMASLLKTFPQTRLVLVGDGPSRVRLEAKVADSRLTDAVVFAGVRRDIPDVLPAFDVYVCSSNYEGISLSVLEAMAASLPIVATCVGGNPELIHDGQTGVLVPARDAGSMARAIAWLLCDVDKARALGEAAGRLARSTFDVRRMLDEYDRLYQALAANLR
jgi:glycosyltransferase involved in cell wall biosynthesis